MNDTNLGSRNKKGRERGHTPTKNPRRRNAPQKNTQDDSLNAIQWIKSGFSGFSPSKKTAQRAIRHMKKREKTQLFSDDLSQMRAAEGRWYESLIYEILLDLALTSDHISYVVKKGADAPFPPVNAALGQNGLYFSARGDINFRGNGQDIAEVDLLFVDKNNAVGFAEIVTSGSDLKEFEEEIHYKKRLLGYLFGQATVPFILFSAVDISRSSVLQRLVRETESVVVITKSCEELKRQISPSSIRGIPRKPIRYPKFLDLKDLQPKRPFDYKKIHDMRRDRVVKSIRTGENIQSLMQGDEIPPLLKKILFGALYPSGIKVIFQNHSCTIQGKTYTPDDIIRDFSKVIIAADLPGFEPVMYLRSRKKTEYLKMVTKKSGEMKVESKRTPRMTGFFLWLESLTPTIGATTAQAYDTLLIKRKT